MNCFFKDFIHSPYVHLVDNALDFVNIYLQTVGPRICLCERWSLVGVAGFRVPVQSPYERHEKGPGKHYYNKLVSRLTGCDCLWQAYRNKQLSRRLLERLIVFHCYVQKYFVTSNWRTWTQSC